MENTEPVKNHLNFTNIIVPAYNLFAIYGDIKRKMPDFKKVIEQGYKIGNYRDLATRLIEKYNPDNNDQNILNNNFFTLVGNPIIGDPAKSGELIIINDLEQKVFESLKLKILNINYSTKLNDYFSLPLARNKEKDKAIYEEIKTNGLPYITILSTEQVKKLNCKNNDLLNVRERILEGLFQGNLIEKKDYITYVINTKQTKNISRLFCCIVDGVTGTRFITACSIHKEFPYATNYYNIHHPHYLLAVNPRSAGAPIATPKKS